MATAAAFSNAATFSYSYRRRRNESAPPLSTGKHLNSTKNPKFKPLISRSTISATPVTSPIIRGKFAVSAAASFTGSASSASDTVKENIDTDQISRADCYTLVHSKPEEHKKLGSYALIGIRPLSSSRFVTFMSRRATPEKRPTKPDPVYRNRLVNMLVNRILKDGKKSLSYQILYRALKRIQQKTNKNPLSVMRQAILRVTPGIAVKARRTGGSTQQVPVEIGSSQGKALAIRWLLAASRKRQGRSMAFKLSSELIDAAKGRGDAIRKREEIHKMAEANRAFANFK